MHWDRDQNTRPYLEVQLGHWGKFGPNKEPWTTVSDATQRLVPPELGAEAFPAATEAQTYVTTNLTPWVHNGNFEESGSWRGVKATPVRLCDSPDPRNKANQGRCYMLWYPSNGESNGYLVQQFSVASRRQPGNYRFETGQNTGIQFEAAFRCPPGSATTPCKVTVYIRKQGGTWAGRTWRIPNDNRWYYVLDDSTFGTDDVSSSIIDLYIDNRGRTMEVDAVWVGSDL